MESPSEETEGAQMQVMTVEVGGQKFQAALYDNETVHAFKERLSGGTVEVTFEAGGVWLYSNDGKMVARSEVTGSGSFQ